MTIGTRVTVRTVQGLRGDWSPIVVVGTIERIDLMPWGMDALVRFDEPQHIGSFDCNEEVAFLSMSLNSPNLHSLTESSSAC